MEILNVMDKAFAPYGKVVTGLNVSDLLAALEKTPKPDDVIYVASDEALEACPSVEKIAYSLFGGMPIQVGYCNGSNYLLNAVEYHRDSEVNVALTDLILILGKEQDIEADGYISDREDGSISCSGRKRSWKYMQPPFTMQPCNVNEK